MPIDANIISLLEAVAPSTSKLIGKILERREKLDTPTLTIILLGVMNENTVKLTACMNHMDEQNELNSKKLDILLDRGKE